MGRDLRDYEAGALKRHEDVKREHEAALNARVPLSRYEKARAGVDGYKKSATKKRSAFMTIAEKKRKDLISIKKSNKYKR